MARAVYNCALCRKLHYVSSSIGKRHRKYEHFGRATRNPSTTTRRQSRRYWFRLPGQGLAAYQTQPHTSLEAAKEEVRVTWGLKRLPRGTEVWT